MGDAILGGLIGGVGSLWGASTAADAQKQAAQMQQQSTMAALGLQRDIYNKNTANEQPWMNAGTNALNLYGNATGANGAKAQQDYFNNFQTDPGYEAALKAGTDAVSNSAAARGTLYGGNTLKAINDYGGGMMQNAFNSRLSNLGTVMGYGAGATNALAGVGTSYANASGVLGTNANNNGTNTLAGAGILSGNGIIGAGNAMIGGINNYNKMNDYNNMNGYNSGYGAYSPGYSSNSWKAWTEQ